MARSAAASKVTSSITAADAASCCRNPLVDLHLGRLGPACRIDGLADDARRGRQRLREVAHRGLEVIAVDVCCACGAVAERLDEDVLGGVIEAARPVEPEVALLGAGGGGERRDQLGPAFAVIRLRFESSDDEDQRCLLSATRRFAGVRPVLADLKTCLPWGTPDYCCYGERSL